MKSTKLSELLNSPWGVVASLGLIIASVEFLIMATIRNIATPLRIPSNYWDFMDAFMLTMIVSPALYFLVFRKMRQSKQEWHDLIEQAADAIFTYDLQGRCLGVNRAACEMFGYSREEFLGFGIRDLVHPDDLVKLAHPDEQAKLKLLFEGKIAINAQRRLRRKDGSYVTVEVHAKRLPDGRLQSIKRDITDRQKLEEALLINASVFDSSLEGIMITDSNNNIIDVNNSFTTITGYSREEVIGKNPKLLSSDLQSKDFYKSLWQSLQQNRSWRGEIWDRRKSGEVYAEILSITVVCDDVGKVQHYVAVFSDISHFKEHVAELSRIAHYDALTGIPNRVLLADRMKQAIAQTDREQNKLAFCLIDLDGFKPVNDALGHEIGDQVLIEVAKRIGNTIRGGDTVARLGGDEFVLLLLGLANEGECVVTLERLLAAVAQPITVKDKSITLSASIGVSFYQQDDENSDNLMRHADQAMYIAKRSGKNRFYIFDLTLDKQETSTDF